MKKKVKSSKIPQRLVCDDDGHWYLMPEENSVRFEQAMELVLANSEYSHLLDEYIKYQIDNVCALRIFKWEEV